MVRDDLPPHPTSVLLRNFLSLIVNIRVMPLQPTIPFVSLPSLHDIPGLRSGDTPRSISRNPNSSSDSDGESDGHLTADPFPPMLLAATEQERSVLHDHGEGKCTQSYILSV